MSSTSAKGPTKIKELPLGKIRRYSSLEDEFKPTHVPLTGEKLDSMVSRLYTPEPLRHRTLVDLSRRQEAARSKYDSLGDRHLSNYWCRLRQRQISRSEARRAQAQEFDQIVANHSDLAAAFFSGTTVPRIATRETPRSRQVHTVTPQSSAPQSPVASASPHASVDRNNELPLALMSSSATTTIAESPIAPLSASNNKPKRGGKKNMGNVAKLTTVCWQSVSDFLPHSDAQLLAMSCFELRQIVCQCRGWPAPDTASDVEDSQPRKSRPSSRRDRSVVMLQVDDPAMNEPAEKPPVAEGDIVIQRRDLTSLWMLADPPAPFMGCVRGLNLSPTDYDLSWLRSPTGRPDPSVSIFNIPDSATDECQGFRLNSPRSIICMLRNGVFLEDLLPRPLHTYYREGILQGALPRIAEKRFAVRETRRQQTLTEMKRMYGSLCAQVSQAHVIQFMWTVCPSEHPYLPIRHDAMKMNDAAVHRQSLSKKLSIISLLEIRQERASDERHATRTNRFEEYVHRNLRAMMDRVKKIREREVAESEKAERRLNRKKDENEQRKIRKKLHDEQVKQVVNDGKLLAEYKRNGILQKIAAHEKSVEQAQRERLLAHQVEQEEKNLLQQQMLEKRIRHERKTEYHRLSIADRIRRKMEKSDAANESRRALAKKMKLAREESSLELEEMANKHKAAVLAFQRREFGRPLQKTASQSTSRARSSATTGRNPQDREEKKPVSNDEAPPPPPAEGEEKLNGDGTTTAVEDDEGKDAREDPPRQQQEEETGAAADVHGRSRSPSTASSSSSPSTASS